LSSKALKRLPSRQSVASFESELSMSRSYHRRLAIFAEISKQAVEAAPVVVCKAERDEGLGNGAAGKGEEVAEEECLRPSEGAPLAEGGPVGAEQPPERSEKRRERRQGARGAADTIRHGLILLICSTQLRVRRRRMLPAA